MRRRLFFEVDLMGRRMGSGGEVTIEFVRITDCFNSAIAPSSPLGASIYEVRKILEILSH